MVLGAAADCHVVLTWVGTQPFKQQAGEHGAGNSEDYGADNNQVLEQRKRRSVGEPHYRADRVPGLPQQRVRA
jgi:hypothetical protein